MDEILVWESGDEVANDVDRSLSEQEKVAALGKLTDQNIGYIERLAHKIDTQCQLESSVSRKSPETILEKSQRPEIRKKKPWFRVEHIRDSLRFRTGISEFLQVESIFGCLQSEPGDRLEVKKIDLEKMFKPKSFGWRCSAFDLFTNGQIVEYYQSFSELIKVNDRLAHPLYEKWRELNDEETQARFAEARQDIEASRDAYDEVWKLVLENLGLTEEDAKRRWAEMAARIIRSHAASAQNQPES